MKRVKGSLAQRVGQVQITFGSSREFVGKSAMSFSHFSQNSWQEQGRNRGLRPGFRPFCSGIVRGARVALQQSPILRDDRKQCKGASEAVKG